MVGCKWVYCVYSFVSFGEGSGEVGVLGSGVASQKNKNNHLHE